MPNLWEHGTHTHTLKSGGNQPSYECHCCSDVIETISLVDGKGWHMACIFKLATDRDHLQAKDEIKCYYRLLTHISAHSCEIFTSARYEMKEKCFKVNSLANQWRKHPAGHAAPGEFSWMLRRRSRHGSKIRRRAEQNKRVKVKHTGQKTVT